MQTRRASISAGRATSRSAPATPHGGGDGGRAGGSWQCGEDKAASHWAATARRRGMGGGCDEGNSCLADGMDVAAAALVAAVVRRRRGAGQTETRIAATGAARLHLVASQTTYSFWLQKSASVRFGAHRCLLTQLEGRRKSTIGLDHQALLDRSERADRVPGAHGRSPSRHCCRRRRRFQPSKLRI